MPSTARGAVTTSSGAGRGHHDRGMGDDAIYASSGGYGYGSDTVDCGESLLDHDVVYYDLFDQVSSNCEERHLTTQLPNL